MVDDSSDPNKQDGVVRGVDPSYAVSSGLSLTLCLLPLQCLSVLPKVAARAKRRTCEKPEEDVLEKRAS